MMTDSVTCRSCNTRSENVKQEALQMQRDGAARHKYEISHLKGLAIIGVRVRKVENWRSSLIKTTFEINKLFNKNFKVILTSHSFLIFPPFLYKKYQFLARSRCNV